MQKRQLTRSAVFLALFTALFATILSKGTKQIAINIDKNNHKTHVIEEKINGKNGPLTKIEVDSKIVSSKNAGADVGFNPKSKFRSKKTTLHFAMKPRMSEKYKYLIPQKIDKKAVHDLVCVKPYKERVLYVCECNIKSGHFKKVVYSVKSKKVHVVCVHNIEKEGVYGLLKFYGVKILKKMEGDKTKKKLVKPPKLVKKVLIKKNHHPMKPMKRPVKVKKVKRNVKILRKKTKAAPVLRKKKVLRKMEKKAKGKSVHATPKRLKVYSPKQRVQRQNKRNFRTNNHQVKSYRNFVSLYKGPSLSKSTMKRSMNNGQRRMAPRGRFFNLYKGPSKSTRIKQTYGQRRHIKPSGKFFSLYKGPMKKRDQPKVVKKAADVWKEISLIKKKQQYLMKTIKKLLKYNYQLKDDLMMQKGLSHEGQKQRIKTTYGKNRFSFKKNQQKISRLTYQGKALKKPKTAPNTLKMGTNRNLNNKPPIGKKPPYEKSNKIQDHDAFNKWLIRRNLKGNQVIYSFPTRLKHQKPTKINTNKVKIMRKGFPQRSRRYYGLKQARKLSKPRRMLNLKGKNVVPKTKRNEVSQRFEIYRTGKNKQNMKKQRKVHSRTYGIKKRRGYPLRTNRYHKKSKKPKKYGIKKRRGYPIRSRKYQTKKSIKGTKINKKKVNKHKPGYNDFKIINQHSNIKRRQPVIVKTEKMRKSRTYINTNDKQKVPKKKKSKKYGIKKRRGYPIRTRKYHKNKKRRTGSHNKKMRRPPIAVNSKRSKIRNPIVRRNVQSPVFYEKAIKVNPRSDKTKYFAIVPHLKRNQKKTPKRPMLQERHIVMQKNYRQNPKFFHHKKPPIKETDKNNKGYKMVAEDEIEIGDIYTIANDYHKNKERHRNVPEPRHYDLDEHKRVVMHARDRIRMGYRHKPFKYYQTYEISPLIISYASHYEKPVHIFQRRISPIYEY